MRYVRLGKAGVDRAKPRADRLDRQMQQLREQRGQDQRHKRSRNARRDPRPHHDDRERRDRDHQCPWIDGFKRVDVGVPFWQKRGRDRLHLESEQVTNLTRKNDERDAAGEPDRHGIRDELDCAAQPE